MCASIARCSAVQVLSSANSNVIVSELHPSAVDPPQFSPTTATATPTEGDQFMFSLFIDANPPPTIDNTTLDGTLVNDTRFTVTATSLTIAVVTRNDSGVYQITASNVAGSGTFTLTVDVYCECVCMCNIWYACYMHHNVSLFSKHVYFTLCADPPEFAVPSQNFTRYRR